MKLNRRELELAAKSAVARAEQLDKLAHRLDRYAMEKAVTPLPALRKAEELGNEAEEYRELAQKITRGIKRGLVAL